MHRGCCLRAGYFLLSWPPPVITNRDLSDEYAYANWDYGCRCLLYGASRKEDKAALLESENVIVKHWEAMDCSHNVKIVEDHLIELPFGEVAPEI